MGYTKILADYLSGLCYSDIPQEASEQAVRLLTQVIAISYEGGRTREAEVLRSLNCKEPGTAETCGSGNYSPAFSALADGVLADALDWEDCAWTGHPSAGIVPVAWILGQQGKVTGKELVTAIVGAYDVYHRIAMSIQPTPQEKKDNGWGLMSWQLFGAVAAGAKVLDFTSAEINQALTLAAATAVLPTSLHDFTLSNGYHFEHGMRNYTAVNILEYVRSDKGKELPCDGLDRYEDFAVHYTSEWKPEWLTRELGEHFYIMDTMLKYYPGNMWIIPAVDAVMNIPENIRKSLNPEEIEKIVIIPGTTGRMKTPDEHFTPTDIVLNVPFAVANALCNPEYGSYWYSVTNIHDPKMLLLAKKVIGSGDPEDSSASGFALLKEGDYPRKIVWIKTKSGDAYSGYSHFPAGHPNNLWSLEKACADYVRIASGTQGKEEARQTALQLVNITGCDDISAIHLNSKENYGITQEKPISVHNNRHGIHTHYTEQIAQYIANTDKTDIDIAVDKVMGILSEQLGENAYYDCLLMGEVLKNCMTLGACADEINTAIGFAATCSLNPRKKEESCTDDFLDTEVRKEAVIIAEIAVKGIYNFMDALDDNVVYIDRIHPEADFRQIAEIGE